MTTQEIRKSPILSYGLGFFAVVLATVLKLAAGPIVGQQSPFLLYSTAVILTAYACGVGPAMMCSVLSALAIARFFPPGGETNHGIQFGMPLMVFVLEGWLIGQLVDRLHISSERLEIEAGKLRESEKRFRQVSDTAPVLIWMSGSDQACLYCNKSWLDFTGSTMEQEQGSGWLQSIHPDDLPRCTEIFDAAFYERKDFSVEYRMRRHDGVYRWVFDTGIPRFSATGEFLGHVGSAMDITDRRTGEEILRASEEQYRLMAEAIPQIVWMASAEGQLEYMNFRWQEYTGMSIDQSKNHGARAAIHPADLERVVESWEECFRAQRTFEIEYRLRRASDGGYRWHLSRGLPVRDAQGHLIKWLGTMTDIDDQKRASEAISRANIELALARDQAVQASSTKAAFLANMSHELRTPLNAILVYIEMVGEEVRKLGNDQIVKDVDTIQSAGSHLLAVINDILDLSRIEAGRMTLKVDPFEVEPMLSNVVETISPLAQKTNNQVETEFAENLGWMRGDETKVRQTLFNLLNNACKFTDNGTIHLRARRNVSALGSETIVFEISDTGIGIERSDFGKLFQIFSQIDQPAPSARSGTGLGLAITKRLVEMMGGAIGFESQVGKGTIFTIILPAVYEEPEAAAAQSAGAFETVR